jgi:hypothetical protein
MPEQPLELSTVPAPAQAEPDYEVIHATVIGSARGRWFLEEYARRNRAADTRLLLAAIERIEREFRAGRDHHAFEHLRSELMEMARSIAQTRADAAKSGRESPRPKADALAEAGAGSDVVSAAERIRDVVRTMRKHGFDPATCEQIETLAGTILRASSLRDSADPRIGKLRAALRYLEQRVDTMREACEQAVTASVATPAVPCPIAASSEQPAGTIIVSKSSAAEAADPATTGLSSAQNPTAVIAGLMRHARAEPAPETTIEPPAGAIPREAAASRSSPVLPAVSEAEPADFLLEPLAPPLAGRVTSENKIAATDATALQPADGLSEGEPSAAAARAASIAPMRTIATPTPRPLPNGALAALKAMSDEERIALFT